MLPSVEKLSIADRQKFEQEASLPLRPAAGVLGKGIRLCANYMQVSKLPVGEIVQYTVEVTPEVPRNMRRNLFIELEKKYRQIEFGGRAIAYDGMSNIYVAGTLPKDQYSLLISIPGRRKDEMRDFQFKIRRVSSVNMETLKKFLDGKLNYTPYDVITALEVILRHPMTLKNAVVGRSIYSGKAVEPISGGIDIWKGFFYSLRPSFGRLLVNVDISATAFIGAGNCLDLVRDYIGLAGGQAFPRELETRQKRNVEFFLRPVRVEATHRECKRRYKVLGLSSNGADKILFTNEQGQELSVVQYFRERYDLQLKEPGAPCLMVGSPQKPIALPLECCRVIAGQRYTRKLDGPQTADMIKIANRKPQERMEFIKKAYGLIDENKDFLNAFGFAIGSDLINIQGRILPAPTIYYNPNCQQPELKPQQGAWNMRGIKVERGATVNSWAVLCMAKFNINEVKDFVRELCVTCNETGMNFEMTQPPLLLCDKPIPESIKEAYSKAHQACGKPPQFILVILQNDDSMTYGEVKRISDTVIGLPSQCMLSKHIRRASKQYCANLALKINLKLGGINSSLNKQLNFITERPTIVFGADVTHPSIGEGEKPSIAALVASLDIKMSRYAATVRVQPSRKEIIEDLQQMAYDHLKEFENLIRVKPHRILFYRDGVSEGQFAQILQYEVPALKAACKQLSPDYNPPITFVLVQKRHHTRFFAVNPSADADRSGNIPAGTIVDSEVVHPNQFDFFLCSHGGIQGTSRPTHYHVVFDENKFKADELQQLSYSLCYTFARCTRSVSVVPPAYYAHLVAFRARYHFRPDAPQSIETFVNVKPELTSGMYFM